MSVASRRSEVADGVRGFGEEADRDGQVLEDGRAFLVLAQRGGRAAEVCQYVDTKGTR
jgi:ketosteroid isomerase-like protein